MENIKTAIDLLGAVYETLNTVPVIGFENQSKMVDCANGIRTVANALAKIQQDTESDAERNGKEGGVL